MDFSTWRCGSGLVGSVSACNSFCQCRFDERSDGGPNQPLDLAGRSMHGMGDPKTCKIASLVKQNSTVAKFRFELANREVSIFFLDLFREGCPKTQNCRISIRITYYARFTDYKPYGLI